LISFSCWGKSRARLCSSSLTEGPWRWTPYCHAISSGARCTGIGPRSYRTYPVRSGEDIMDIISKRSITREEVDALNPDMNLDKLSCEVLRLLDHPLEISFHPASAIRLSGSPRSCAHAMCHWDELDKVASCCTCAGRGCGQNIYKRAYNWTLC